MYRRLIGIRVKVEQVLATQCLIHKKAKNLLIKVKGRTGGRHCKRHRTGHYVFYKGMKN
jgi:hypothetical protein